MTIEIHQPELEALIQQRMDSGAFQDVEDILLQALKSLPSAAQIEETNEVGQPRKSFADFLIDSPLPGSGLILEKAKDYPRLVEL